MSTNKIARFVLAASAAGLMLAAASSASVAAPHHPPHYQPTCDASCQSNKAMPSTKLQPAKSTAAPNAAGKNLRQR